MTTTFPNKVKIPHNKKLDDMVTKMRCGIIISKTDERGIHIIDENEAIYFKKTSKNYLLVENFAGYWQIKEVIVKLNPNTNKYDWRCIETIGTTKNFDEAVSIIATAKSKIN